MNEQRYKKEHLRYYRGILTSEVRGNDFKMELKIEDNSVLKRSKNIKSNIELEFKYDSHQSTRFLHDIHLCETENCQICEVLQKTYNKFEQDIGKLQLGDTFEIRAALINNYESVLPREIGDFTAYQPLIATFGEFPENSHRLPDTPEGINKKYEIEQQRLQSEREEEEKREEEEEKRKIEADKAQRREKWDRLEQMFAKYPYTIAIGIAIIGTSLTYEGLRFIGKKIISLIFPN